MSLKFVRYSIGIWAIESKENNELAGIAKMEAVDLKGDKFNEFVSKKLEIIKKLINEI